MDVIWINLNIGMYACKLSIYAQINAISLVRMTPFWCLKKACLSVMLLLIILKCHS